MEYNCHSIKYNKLSKVECICGQVISLGNKRRHCKTKKHWKNLIDLVKTKKQNFGVLLKNQCVGEKNKCDIRIITIKKV